MSLRPPSETPAGDATSPATQELLHEFAQLYHAVPIGLASLDRELRFVRVNDCMAALAGRPVEAHRGRSLAEVLPGARRAEWFARDVLETGREILDVETEIAPATAPTRVSVWLLSFYPVRDQAGAVAGVNLVVQDVTEREGSETSLRDRLRFETLLADVSTRFINAPTEAVDAEVESGLRKIVEFFKVHRSTLIQFSEDGKTLGETHSWAVEGVPRASGSSERFDFRWGLAQLRAGEIFRFSRPEELPPEAVGEKEYCTRTGFKASMGIPLSIGGELRGAIMTGSFGVERRWPDIAVQRLRLFGEIIANALQRKQADEALRRSHEEIRTLKDRLQEERDYLREEIYVIHNHEEVVGQSEAMQKVLGLVEQVAPKDATVLVIGETGTGKELVARAIHNLSARKNRAMVKVNCAALPSTLVESELFGREKGAYTGAVTRQLGRFEIANGSTVFLDEIGELPLDLQAKLLRVLQEGDFERLGSNETIHVSVRVIAATNRDLLKEVRAGKFREDLYYRLNVFPILVPPLRERTEDIPLLVWSFVKQFGAAMGIAIEKIARANMEALARYPWPGNVRELRNIVERAMILSRGSTLRIEVPATGDATSAAPLTLEAREREYILEVLERTNWRIRGTTGAAAILGLKPTTLYSRMKKLGIEKPRSA